MRQTIESYVPQVASENRRFTHSIYGSAALFAVIWMAAIVLAPTLAANNIQMASVIHGFFGFLCHQIAERAFFLQGEPFAVCARCFGIYAGIAGGILIYPLVRSLRDLTPPPRVLLIFALIPLTVDWGLGVLGVWQNTHWSRFLTGAILGVVCAFFIVPGLIEIGRSARRKWFVKVDENH